METARTESTPRIDATNLAVLPVRDLVVFPHAVVPVLVGRERSRRLVEALLDGDEATLAVTSAPLEGEEPGPADLQPIGTEVRIVQAFRFPDGNFRLIVRGERRVRLGAFTQTHPFLRADAMQLVEGPADSPRAEALARELASTFGQLVETAMHLPDEVALRAEEMEDPSALADFVAASLDMERETRQELLEMLDVEERLERLVRIAARELEVVEVGSRIQEQVATELQDGQREAILRRQLEAIRRELGEGDDEDDVAELRRRLEEADLPEEASKEAMRELARMERLPAASQEHGVIRGYLDWMVRFPWHGTSDASIDVAAAREVLDEDHHGLDEVKERVLEYLAVRSLKSDMKGPILLFVGAPGVGKTSLGRSIASALGREFVRISLGGVRDEAEIRGHRRTYVGAMPGRIVQGLVRAGSRDPVVMLDEVDKLGMDFRGDPAAALLEVLDPEQNHDFRDHYLDVPVDLSRAIFIATANVMHTIPAPLLDRMERVELAGYTVQEKLAIATDHLVPKQIEAHGLADGAVTFDPDALEAIASTYTREAGVRALDRSIAKVIRKAVRMIVEGEEASLRVTPEVVRDLLGPERYRVTAAEGADEVGLVAGLAVTGTGGDVLFVETSLVPGGGKVTTTGHLGDVMRESAQAATTYVRSRAGALGLRPGWLDEVDIHIHVPEGAVPKDGPSAGVTMTTALASAVTGRAVRRDVAMTGEVTLRGKVLPIGGLREKLAAAHRAGMNLVVVPEANESDLADVPAQVLEGLDVEPVGHMDQVLELALVPPLGGASG